MKSKIENCVRRLALSFVLLLAVMAQAQGQNLIVTTAGDEGDARATFLNPAMAALQDPLFTLGSKALYYGFTAGALDLRHSYFSITTPNRSVASFGGFAYGLQGQMLQTPMFDAVAVNALFAKRLHQSVTAGASVGFLHRSFDRSTFVLEAENDPLLNNLSKWIFPDLSLGLMTKPSRNVTLGMSVNHVNRPNLAVEGEEARLAPTFNAGGAVGMGYFRAIFGFSVEEGDFIPRLGFESFRRELGHVRAGYGREAATFEAEVYVMPGVNLSYRYSYPLNDLRLASSGSHELGMVFNFKRRNSIYVAEWLEPDMPPRPIINPNTAFTVRAIFDTLLVVDRHITRHIDSTISKRDLASLPRHLLVRADSLEPDLPTIGALRLKTLIEYSNGTAFPKLDSAAVTARLLKDHRQQYLDFLRSLADSMETDTTMTARMVVPADGERVQRILQYIGFYGKVTDRLSLAVREKDAKSDTTGKLGRHDIPPIVHVSLLSVPADTFLFTLDVPELRYGPVSWELMITDHDQKPPLKKYSGTSQIPRRWVWDWRFEDGSVAAPGVYYYFIKWQAEDGTVYTSPKRPLVVSNERKYIDIRLTKTALYNGKPGGKLIYYVN